jgi:hypothetical protein
MRIKLAQGGPADLFAAIAPQLEPLFAIADGGLS